MSQILFELLRDWPGVIGRPDPALVDDSLALLPLLGEAGTLIDVGSGGGLPGLPLKLARPDLEVTLLEANRRKAAFLTHASARVGAEVAVVAERAETAAHRPELRERFDVATARAVASLPVLLELTLPFVRVGGRLLAMKAAVEEELVGAAPALAVLGGRLQAVETAPTALRREGRVVVIEKIAATPAGFPRRPGLPARRPLAGTGAGRG